MASTCGSRNHSADNLEMSHFLPWGVGQNSTGKKYSKFPTYKQVPFWEHVHIGGLLTWSHGGQQPVGGRRMKHTSSSTWGAAPTRGDAPQHRPHDPDEGCPQSPEDSFLWLTPTTSWTQAQSLASTSFPAPCQTSSLPADRLLNSLVAHPVLFVFSILPVISFPTMDGRVHL